VRTLERRENAIANLRLFVFAVCVCVVWASWWMNWFNMFWVALPAASFVCLAVAHDRTLRALGRARLAVAHYDRCLARVNDTWAGKGRRGDDLLPASHPYAADLDIFGAGSLFELLCAARTRAGEQVLADWLSAPACADIIRARQEALAELRDGLDLGEDLALLGADVDPGVLPDVLVKWANAPQAFTTNGPRIVAFVVGVYNILALIAWPLFGTGPSPFVLGLIAAIMLARFAGGAAAKGVLHAIEEPGRELDVLAKVLARLERERFEHGRLRDLHADLTSGGVPASVCIERLRKLLSAHESRNNQLFAGIALMLMWDVHFAYAFESWRKRHGANVKKWLDALGELEALCSLAAYHYERPDDPFPEIGGQDAVFDGIDVGHPLLSSALCVRNSVRLDAKTRLFIVSGSNMSGKSTLLRTVGINVVLALAGAPVRAKSLHVSPLAVGATLRVQDSIQSGDSRFYAEIRRLHRLSQIASGPLPLLFLLDEILHGTNSHDRKIGAEAVIRRFLDSGGIGLVTTHDLALTQAVDAFAPVAINVHFEDHIEDGKLAFDYTMRPGVVQKSNALELMRRIGLDI
jgi:hypothetical protein